MHRAVEMLDQPHLPTPPAPPVFTGSGVDPVAQVIFQKQVKEYGKHSNKLEENIKSLWSLVSLLMPSGPTSQQQQ